MRLIPDAHSPERSAIKTLFNHRLSPEAQSARAEWLDIVEARHALWLGIASEKLELIRSIFNVLNLEIVKRARPTSVFNFESASVGNMFLTGWVGHFFHGPLISLKLTRTLLMPQIVHASSLEVSRAPFISYRASA